MQDWSCQAVSPEPPIHDRSNCKSDRVHRPEPFHQGFPPNRGCHADTVPSSILTLPPTLAAFGALTAFSRIWYCEISALHSGGHNEPCVSPKSHPRRKDA